MPELVLRSGKKSGRRIPLPTGDVTIGRDDGCQIRLNSSDVSRHHCRMRCSDDGVLVADLGSRNGTFVNEMRISAPTPLHAGDLLRVGPFAFQMPGPASRAPANASGEREIENDIAGWLTVEGRVAEQPSADRSNDTALVPNVEDEGGDAAEEDQGQESETPTTLAPTSQREDAVNASDPAIAQASEIIQDFWRRKSSRRSR